MYKNHFRGLGYPRKFLTINWFYVPRFTRLVWNYSHQEYSLHRVQKAIQSCMCKVLHGYAIFLRTLSHWDKLLLHQSFCLRKCLFIPHATNLVHFLRGSSHTHSVLLRVMLCVTTLRIFNYINYIRYLYNPICLSCLFSGYTLY